MGMIVLVLGAKNNIVAHSKYNCQTRKGSHEDTNERRTGLLNWLTENESESALTANIPAFTAFLAGFR